MRIAIPVINNKLCMHFGHCEVFRIFDVENNKILGFNDLTPPMHEPGVLPRWIKDNGVDIVIAGGMGSRAQNLFVQNGVKVLVGANELDPSNVVTSYLNGNLNTGANACDH